MSKDTTIDEDSVNLIKSLGILPKIPGGIYNTIPPCISTLYFPSVASLQELKQLYVIDLRRDSHHRGRYVVLKIVDSSKRLAAVTELLLEDEIGNTVRVQLCYLGEDLQPAVGDVPASMVCIIKEPWYTMMSDRNYGLRVDHISDVIWLSMAHDRMPPEWRPRFPKTAIQLKDSGNDALKRGKLLLAIEFYDAALQIATSPEVAVAIKLNRSLANLRIGYFEQALEDAGGYPAVADNSEKGFFRAARSLYELGRFQESHGVFKYLLSAYPGCEAAKKELCRAENRLREQSEGLFDFLVMQKAAAEKVPPYLDVATYDAPVTIKITEGRGRGLFTTRDVAAGDLLLCEKALSYSCYDSTSTTSLPNASTLKGTTADLVISTVHQLSRNPSRIPSVLSLHRGTCESVKEKMVDGTPIIDSFLITQIVSFNAFKSHRVTVLNKLGEVEFSEAERAESFLSCGLYIKASYVNHSCYINARRSFIGDVLIMRATRNIAAGEEILFGYTTLELNHICEKKKDGDLHGWGFCCCCEICMNDQETSNKKKKKRAALMKELILTRERPVDKAGLAAIEKLLAAVEQTYTAPASSVPRLALWGRYLNFSRFFASIHWPERVITTIWKALAAFGYVIKQDASSVFSPFQVEQWGMMDDSVVEAWVHLWTAYEILVPRCPGLCEKAEDYARITYKICVGEDKTFEERVGSMAREVIMRLKDS